LIKSVLKDESGQAILEFTLVVPLILLLVLGVVEVSYATLDQHVVSKLSREGSNLISRDTSLGEAATAMASMSSRPVNFNDGSSKVIFSVVKKVATVGAANFNKPVLYQRFVYGTFAGSSVLDNAGGAFGPAPEYTALNSDNDPNLQVSNVPATMATGGLLYITEIFTRHPLITPLNRLGIFGPGSAGIQMPTTLYSIAYF
jgi:Flp pilus assembly pilin Flp